MTVEDNIAAWVNSLPLWVVVAPFLILSVLIWTYLAVSYRRMGKYW